MTLGVADLTVCDITDEGTVRGWANETSDALHDPDWSTALAPLHSRDRHMTSHSQTGSTMLAGWVTQ